MDKTTVGQRFGLRFSLKLLLLSVVPVSLAAAAARSANTAWATGAVTVTLLAIFGAIIAAAFDDRCRRPIWTGFAICAGGYLLALFMLPYGTLESLGTERLNQLLLEKLHPGCTYPAEIPFICPSLNEPRDDQQRFVDADRSGRSLVQFVSVAIIATRSATAPMLFAVADDGADAPSSSESANAGPSSSPGPTASVVPATIQQLADAAEISRQVAAAKVAENFKEIVRSAWAWLIGACGAFFAMCVATRNGLVASNTDCVSGSSAYQSTPPSRMRPTLFGAAIFLTGTVLGGFALCRPGEGWASAAMSSVVIVSVGFSVFAIHGSVGSRPFRCGFAICCGGYFLLYLCSQRSSGGDTSLCQFLAAGAPDKSLGTFFNHYFKDYGPAWKLPDSFDSVEPLDPSVEAQEVKVAPPNLVGDFLIVGQDLWALAFGTLGASLAQFLVWRRSKRPAMDHLLPNREFVGVLHATD